MTKNDNNEVVCMVTAFQTMLERYLTCAEDTLEGADRKLPGLDITFDDAKKLFDDVGVFAEQMQDMDADAAETE